MRLPVIAAACAVMLAFCNENRADHASSAPSISASGSAPPAYGGSATDEAKQIAQVRCAMCHGASGKGDGPNSATLVPKPRDLTNKDWQKTMSDAQLRSVILKGGPALGKSPLMPSNPDLYGG